MKLTDLIVVFTALSGAALAIFGLVQLDPRIRNRGGRLSISTSKPLLVAFGLVLAGVLLITLAIGGFSG